MGLKYAFPAQHGEVTRGVPTSYAASPETKSPLRVIAPVWPWRDGETRGVSLEPLYKSVPHAALRDPALLQLLALIDAIRDGTRARAKSGRTALSSQTKVAHGQS